MNQNETIQEKALRKLLQGILRDKKIDPAEQEALDALRPLLKIPDDKYEQIYSEVLQEAIENLKKPHSLLHNPFDAAEFIIWFEDELKLTYTKEQIEKIVHRLVKILKTPPEELEKAKNRHQYKKGAALAGKGIAEKSQKDFAIEGFSEIKNFYEQAREKLARCPRQIPFQVKSTICVQTPILVPVCYILSIITVLYVEREAYTDSNTFAELFSHFAFYEYFLLASLIIFSAAAIFSTIKMLNIWKLMQNGILAPCKYISSTTVEIPLSREPVYKINYQVLNPVSKETAEIQFKTCNKYLSHAVSQEHQLEQVFALMDPDNIKNTIVYGDIAKYAHIKSPGLWHIEYNPLGTGFFQVLGYCFLLIFCAFSEPGYTAFAIILGFFIVYDVTFVPLPSNPADYSLLSRFNFE